MASIQILDSDVLELEKIMDNGGRIRDGKKYNHWSVGQGGSGMGQRILDFDQSMIEAAPVTGW